MYRVSKSFLSEAYFHHSSILVINKVLGERGWHRRGSGGPVGRGTIHGNDNLHSLIWQTFIDLTYAGHRTGGWGLGIRNQQDILGCFPLSARGDAVKATNW